MGPRAGVAATVALGPTGQWLGVASHAVKNVRLGFSKKEIKGGKLNKTYKLHNYLNTRPNITNNISKCSGEITLHVSIIYMFN